MLPLYRDPHDTFRFADDRLIPRFHLATEAVRAVMRYGFKTSGDKVSEPRAADNATGARAGRG